MCLHSRKNQARTYRFGMICINRLQTSTDSCRLAFLLLIFYYCTHHQTKTFPISNWLAHKTILHGKQQEKGLTVELMCITCEYLLMFINVSTSTVPGFETWNNREFKHEQEKARNSKIWKGEKRKTFPQTWKYINQCISIVKAKA